MTLAIVIFDPKNGSPVVLANIYAPNDDNPQFYLDVFAHLDRFDQSCLIVGGDLNLVLGDLGLVFAIQMLDHVIWSPV